MARVTLDTSAGTGLYIEYSISAPDYVNARYTLTMSLQARKLNSNYGTYKESAACYLSGYGSFSVNYDQRSWNTSDYHTLKSVSVYVGFGSSYTMSGTLNLSGTTAGKLTGSSKVTMSSPSRLSYIEGLGSEFDLGAKATFTLKEMASALVTKITYKLGNATGTISSDAAAGSNSWTIPTSLATEFLTHEAECVITVSTYSGSTLIGSKTYPIDVIFIPTYIYNGSEWKKAIPYVYDGSEWVEAVPYVHNGSKWAA